MIRESSKYQLEDSGGNISRSQGLDFRLWPQDMDNPVYQTQLLPAFYCKSFAEEVAKLHATKQSFRSLVFNPRRGVKQGPNPKSRNSYSLRPELPLFQPLFKVMNEAAESGKIAFGGGLPKLRPFSDQALIYEKGGFFQAHTDDSIPVGPPGQQTWNRNQPNRQLVGLLYLNDDFDGGGIQFTNFVERETGQRKVIRPHAGLFILFPAHPWYKHQVLEVKDGVRFAISRWWTVFNNTVVA